MAWTALMILMTLALMTLTPMILIQMPPTLMFRTADPTTAKPTGE
jgi:hypothetical protein